MAILAREPLVQRKLTYEEFLNRDDELNAAEWVDGEIIPMTVCYVHNDLSHFLITLLSIYVKRTKLGKLFAEPFQMKTGPELPGRSPDICFLLNENMSRRKTHYIDGPADLVIEVISPESAVRDRGDKFIEYQKGGVQEYWIIDPIRKFAEFYVRGEDNYFHPRFPDSTGRLDSAVLKGLWINVEWFWQSPLPDELDIVNEWGLLDKH